MSSTAKKQHMILYISFLLSCISWYNNVRSLQNEIHQMDMLKLECQGYSDLFKEFLPHFKYLREKICWRILSGSEM